MNENAHLDNVVVGLLIVQLSKNLENTMNKLKLTFFTLALVGISHLTFSQAQNALGIKGGPNFANIDTDASPGQNYDNRTGFHGGAFALFKFGSFGIQPEVLFSQQGSTVSISSNQDLDRQINYINVPVIFKLYTIAGLNLQVGPQVGFLSSAEAESVVNGINTTSDIKDELKSNDFAIALGAGWDLPFGLTIDARYNWGLTDYNDQPSSNEFKNQVWQISAGFKLIKLGGR